MNAEVLALIPARGGSKSIPLKNLLMVAGKPLIAHTIEQALNSRKITRTIVSTDHEEIAAVAREFGAEVPFMRPTEFALDWSPDIDVFRHAVEWLRDHQGYEPELIVHLRPTGPVRRVELIDQAIETMLSASAVDSLRSVNRAVQTPYKMWSVDQGILRPLLQLEGTTEPYNLPRQQLPQVYWQNGYVDIVRPRTVLRGLMSGGSILPFIVDEPMLEIDYEDDVAKVEEALLKLRETGQIEPDADPGRHSV
jgi:N-acylneuraminate cytidylyltransferase